MPPKRKKSAKNKLAKMTEEERAEYLKQQLIKEEQMKKQKEELLVLFLKEKLVKEERAARHNMVRIQNQWIHIMRLFKARDLKSEIESLSKEFEKQIDRKMAITQSLITDMEQSEEQQMMRMRRYAESLDELIALQAQRLVDLENAFETELATLETEFEEERSLMIALHKKNLSDEADIRFCIRTKFTKEEETAKAEFQMECDELKNKNLEDKHSLRMMLEQQLADMWDEFRRTTKDYQECTQERRKQFDALKDRDQKLSKEIDEQGKKLKLLERKIEGCKRELKSTTQVATERQRMLKEQKASLLSQFQDMKGYMTQFSQAEMRKLKRLCTQSEDCIRDVDQKVKLGEEVLSLAEICRHYETEQEKILPFYTTAVDSDPELVLAQQVERNAEFPEDLRQVVDLSETLEGFWKRFNKVKLDDLAVSKELDQAKEHNKNLQAVLGKYLEGLSVPQNVMAQANPLVVVKRHAPQARDPAVQARSILPVGADKQKSSSGATTAAAAAGAAALRRANQKPVVEAAHAVKNLTLA
ncbi:dynein regulatory complex subunit 2-like [Sycon ciliatum]|uniref:dynein regulatory complex subunit 2-like n=1 Tax=Sycon ciliatum TaxID=27933 RepID=UPI0031F70DF6